MADKPSDKLKVSELKQAHSLYSKNVANWYFLLACYAGARELISLGYVLKHERESQQNYNRRVDEAYGFSYSKSVVDLLCFYLFKKPVKRDLGPLNNDPSYTLFAKDCNLYGDSMDFFLHTQARYASILGHVGILVDKASVTYNTLREELDAGVYPYVSAYFPTAILDWKYDKDQNNRPYLAYLKLRDDDGTYRIWTRDEWKIYEEPEPPEKGAQTTVEIAANQQTSAQNSSVGDMDAKLVAKGINPLGEIPFVWLYNIRSEIMPIGIGDIDDIGRIDVSIMRNLSQGEEIINYAAFPMMRKPMREKGSPTTQDEVGPTAVLEFDPENADAKPDWLDSQVGEPITAILAWISRKVEEIYRTSNSGGMAATEISTSPKSGTALKTEFQLLNSKLVSKAMNLEKAELRIIQYWGMWQSVDQKIIDDVTVERERTYDVEDLATDLENIMTSMTIVQADEFKKALRKMVARRMLPAYTDEQFKEIDKAIDEYVPPTIPTGAFDSGAGAPNAREGDNNNNNNNQGGQNNDNNQGDE